MKKVGIIGYGRFGKVLADLMANKYEVMVYDNNPKTADKIDARRISNKAIDLFSEYVFLLIIFFLKALSVISISFCQLFVCNFLAVATTGNLVLIIVISCRIPITAP